MKQLIPLLVIVFLISCKTREIQVHEVSYDYATQNNPKLDIQRHNKDAVIIKIENINKLIFNMSDSGHSQSTSLSNINIFDTLLTNMNKSQPSQEKNSSEIAKLTKILSQLITYLPEKKVVSTTASKEELLRQQAIILAKINPLRVAIASNVKDLIVYQDKLKKFLQFGRAVINTIFSEKYSQNTIRAEIARQYKLFIPNNNTSTETDLLLISNNTMADVTDYINNRTEKVTEINNQLETWNTIIQDLIKDYKESTSFIDSLTIDVIGYANNVLSNASTPSIDSLNIALSSVKKNLAQANDPLNFSYKTAKYHIEGNFYDINVYVAPKEQFKNIYDSSVLRFRFPVKGKFEWAIGPSLCFGFTNGNFDNSYTVDTARHSNGTIKEDTFNIQKNKTNNTLLPSIGVMAHFYWQQHWAVTPGISVGISTSPNDLSQLKAYAGACFLVGGFTTDSKKNLVYNKLIFSIGASYGSVSRLKGSLAEGENPKSRMPYNGNTIAADQLTEKVGKIGMYFGLSYKIN